MKDNCMSSCAGSGGRKRRAWARKGSSSSNNTSHSCLGAQRGPSMEDKMIGPHLRRACPGYLYCRRSICATCWSQQSDSTTLDCLGSFAKLCSGLSDVKSTSLLAGWLWCHRTHHLGPPLRMIRCHRRRHCRFRSPCPTYFPSLPRPRSLLLRCAMPWWASFLRSVGMQSLARSCTRVPGTVPGTVTGRPPPPPCRMPRAHRPQHLCPLHGSMEPGHE